MPRKKKSGQSPARVPSGLLDGGTHTGNHLPPMASNLIPAFSLPGTAKEDIVRNMQEMFSHLDPEVIYIVLSECDFKVENAMDSLLELSVAATDPPPVSTSNSGFERTAAALLSPQHFAESRSLMDTSTQLQCTSTSPTSFMTEDLDFLIDQEVLSLSAEENIERYQLEGKNITVTECPESNLERQCSRMSSDKSQFLENSQRSGAASPLDQLSAFEEHLSVVDAFPTETIMEKNMSSTGVFTSSHPSALQMPLKQSVSNPGDPAIKPSISNEIIEGSEPITWNIEAPVFYPQMQVKQGPTFITPVASNWPREQRPTIPWHRPVSQAQVRPCPPVPMPVTPAPPQPLNHSRLLLEGMVLVLLRGPPGSGKSTLARALLEHNPGGVVLSTDDFFILNGQYHFDPNVLGEAHSWNHNRAKQAFERGDNPIIIDNTNMQGWEMKPYVTMALKHHYKVLFREPDTWWKNKPKELERRTKHGVPSERIRRMLCGYERFVTVKSILGSQMPERKQVAAETEDKLINCSKNKVPCSDIVGEPTGKNIHPHTEAAPSLPDVSTTHDSDYSTEILINAGMDMGALDSELDKIHASEEIISDSIVESDINNDHCLDEIPVAFSESIGQRMKRERIGEMSGFELAYKQDDASIFEKSSSLQREMPAEERAKSVEIRKLEFKGDWPLAASLDQRRERRRERWNDNDRCPEKPMGDISGATNQSSQSDVSNLDIAELHTLFDLIQTGADPIRADFSTSSHIFQNSEEEPNISLDQPQGSPFKNKEQIVKESITVELPDCVLNSEAVGLTLVGENKPEMDYSVNDNTTHCGEVCENLECETYGETESGHSGDVPESEEHKQHHTRRSGKQCKLALTFSQNCLEESVDSVLSSAAVETNDGQSLDLKTGSESCTEAKKREEGEALSTSFTQTESQDFAILWRVNENNFNASEKPSSDFSILSCDPIRFVPCATGSFNLTNCEEIPYYVVHEKSTQVEEEELGPTQDVLKNLDILKRHFKQVTLDTLEDLFEKCHRDLEWTTNLLLDSGERFFRDDESEDDASCTGGGDIDDGQRSHVISILQFEELAGSNPDVLVEEIEYSNNTSSEPVESNNCDCTVAPSILDAITHPHQNNNKNDDAILKQINENRTNMAHDNTQVGVTLPCEGEKCEAGAESADVSGVHMKDDIRSISEIHRLLEDELEELEREEKARRKTAKLKKKQLLDIKSVELKLPTELAFQLTELFGPVDVDPDTGSPEDYVLQMDLNLAKLLHQKWKESVQERQKQAALSYRLLQGSSSHWDKPPQWTVPGSSPGHFQMNAGGTSHLGNHPDAGSPLPFMDHWNVSQPHVSLRDVIKEEVALQENREKVRKNRADVEKRDGAALLKEDQLFALFPTIDRHFLQDIFRDHNYSLTQTQLFLHSLLDEEPVKTVVAPEPSRVIQPRATSKDRDKKSVEPGMASYQDTEDPEYQDFRAEANLQRKRQIENFAKAAEAYKQGHKEVASFYAQQGHLHGQRMREANHRAAVQIFERVNSSLLPRNILDLHGLHVEEALHHLGDVLETKTSECVRGLCRPQLSVITGRGNHSQGGVARIRPAVLDYLTKKHYRFTEPKPGLVLVSLK